MENKESIVLACIADTHTGGTTSLHPNVRKVLPSTIYRTLLELGGWFYKHNQHFYLSSVQEKIWRHFDNCLTATFDLRKNKKLVLLMAGDAVDSTDHHNTPQVTTKVFGEQIDTHIEMMEYVKDRLAFQDGDTLLYVTGTETHVKDEENGIAKRLGAYRHESGYYSADFLELTLNGVLTWIFHEGVSAGKHPNRGNAQVATMKRIYYDCLANGKPIPRLIVTAHTHDSHHAIYSPADGIEMHYVILPSWQDKTRYVIQRMALATNKVGMRNIEITPDGKIIIYDAMLLENQRGEVLSI